MCDYYWMIYRPCEPLFAELRHATLVRLFYIVTFLTSQGYLKDGNKFIRKQDLQDYLKISRREQYRFWNEVNSANIIREKNDCLYVNSKYFITRDVQSLQVKRMKENNLNLTKIYSQSVIELYNQAVDLISLRTPVTLVMG